MIAGGQRKGNLKLPPPTQEIVKEAFRKLRELAPWVHHIKKLQAKTTTVQNPAAPHGEKRKAYPVETFINKRGLPTVLTKI